MGVGGEGGGGVVEVSRCGDEEVREPASQEEGMEEDW